uniref:C2H2-type domain-containing protein n=1 Tax=Solanum lycopersicum TaxID=4081 RepID=K4CYC3_SOLLC
MYCGRRFYSSQAIAAHTRCHFKDGWVKGTPQRNFFVSFFDFQHDFTLISSIPQPDAHSANVERFPPSLTSSSRGQPQVPMHHLRLPDANTLCAFKASLNKEEEEVILILRDFPETEKRIKKAKH